MKTDNLIVTMTFDFSLQIIALYKKLIEHKEFVLSKQLLRSTTSIGANVEEATAGQTKKDFIAKMAIASKEARETRYWLRLLNHSKLVTENYEPHLVSIENIINVLTKIVKTAQTTI